MRVSQTSLMLAAAAVTGLLACVRGWGPPECRPAVAEALRAETPYVVEAGPDGALFDLPFANGERYILVVSSLGDAERQTTVHFRASAVPEVRRQPLEPLPPLGPRRSPGPDRPSSRSATPVAARSAEADRVFHVHVTDGDLSDPNQYARVTAALVGEGRRARVYLDRQLAREQLAAGTVEEIVRLFDDEIHPRASERLGEVRDVDGDGKFTILLSPWLERLQGGRVALGGFVRGGDFRDDERPPFGNRCDMLYLNANVRPGPHLGTLLAHEFAHAVAFSTRLGKDAARPALPAEEDWLNEGLAHLAENLHGDCWSNLDYRVAAYLEDPAAHPLAVADYYRAGLWRDPGCRGATYLFLRWCADQFGEGVAARLIAGPNSGRENVALATGMPFDELYRRWSVSLIQSARRPAGSEPLSGEWLRHLDICGKIGRVSLAGPRVETWDVAADHEVCLKGTASTFLEVRSDGSLGARRVEIRAEDGVALQATVVPMDPDSPEIRATACWDTAALEPVTGNTGGKSLVVRVEGSEDVAVERISCGPAPGGARCVSSWSAEGLASLRRETPGDSAGTEWGLPFRKRGADGEPRVVTVVAADGRGRRAVRRVDVPAPPAGDERLRVASRER